MTLRETPTRPTSHRTPWDALDASPSGSTQLFQRCLRCGTEESAGQYCSWCQMAASDLIDHTHAFHTCPLGPYLNPSVEANRGVARQAQLAKDRAAWDASHDPADAEPYIVRRWHHPANPSIARDAVYLERHPDAATIATREKAA